MSEEKHIQCGNRKIDFEIVRSNRRRTVGIYIVPGRSVVVRAPHFLRVDEVLEVVRKRAKWIVEKQEILKNESKLNPVKEFVSGEGFHYLGRQYRLKVKKSASEKEDGCKLINGRFLVGIDGQFDGKRPQEIVKEALMNWYLARAHEKIPQRVKLYAHQIGTWPRRIEIKNYKRQWGSCSHNGVIRFNWKIIMAPLTVLDYVIVHELCHLIYSNHSALFWQKVQTVIPDYKIKRNRLRSYSLQIESFD